MIIYFSGTGNSAYAAKKLANELHDEVSSLFSKIREHKYEAMTSTTPWVMVVPTYAWRIPRVVETWLRHTPLQGSRELYFVMTCGGSIGNASAYLASLCQSLGYTYCGCAAVVMPENYTALYPTPDTTQAQSIIAKADPILLQIAQQIKQKTPLPEQPATSKDKFCSGLINKLFYSFIVKADKFYVRDDCIACGTCVSLCPLANIHLLDGKAVWGKSCTHCMACINRCPQQAIEYGKHTANRHRYVCPQK